MRDLTVTGVQTCALPIYKRGIPTDACRSGCVSCLPGGSGRGWLGLLLLRVFWVLDPRNRWWGRWLLRDHIEIRSGAAASWNLLFDAHVASVPRSGGFCIFFYK